MNFAKKNSRWIITIIVSIILASGISVYATTTYLASQINYTTEKNAEIENVEDALDELYTKTNKEILNQYTISLRAGTSSTIDAESLFNFSGSTRSNYKYFKITSLTTNANASYGKCFAWSTKQNKSIELSLNSEYEVFSNTDDYCFSGVMVNTISKSNGSWATCLAEITFYNK